MNSLKPLLILTKEIQHTNVVNNLPIVIERLLSNRQ